jgi:hypothetical protein
LRPTRHQLHCRTYPRCSAPTALNTNAAAAAAPPPPPPQNAGKSQAKPKAGPDPKLVNQYGEPIAFSNRGISHLNQPFWAASYAKRKIKFIHEPAEREFYNYDDATGIFAIRSPDRIRAELGALILDAAKTWPGLSDLQNYRNEKTLTGIISHLRGLVEERDFFNITSPVVHLGNCTLVFKPDGSSFSVEPFSPKHRSRNRSPINYDPKADCPEFKRLMLSLLMSRANRLKSHGISSHMNPNPVPEAETKRFTELLSNTLARADQLANDELGQALRTAIATFMIQGDICSKVLTMHGEQIGALSQTLLMVSQRLERIEAILNSLCERTDDHSADWWKQSGTGNN